MRGPGTIAATRRAVLPRCGGPRQSESVCSSENSLPTTISNANDAPQLCCYNGKEAKTDRGDAVRRSGDSGLRDLTRFSLARQWRNIARACPHVRLVPGLIASLCPSPPACGGRGRGPAWLRREGEVASSAVRDGGLPHLTPTLSAPRGRRGGYSSRLSGCEICACPSAFAGMTKERAATERQVRARPT